MNKELKKGYINWFSQKTNFSLFLLTSKNKQRWLIEIDIKTNDLKYISKNIAAFPFFLTLNFGFFFFTLHGSFLFKLV